MNYKWTKCWKHCSIIKKKRHFYQRLIDIFKRTSMSIIFCVHISSFQGDFGIKNRVYIWVSNIRDFRPQTVFYCDLWKWKIKCSEPGRISAPGLVTRRSAIMSSEMFLCFPASKLHLLTRLVWLLDSWWWWAACNYNVATFNLVFN